MPLTLTKPSDLADRLAELPTLADVPRAEVEWLAATGEFRRYEPDEVMLRRTEDVIEMVVMLSGRILVTFEHASGHQHSMESRTGSLTGLLPYSRLTRALGDIVATETTDIVGLHRDHFPEMITRCPMVTTTVVHMMIDRARTFAGFSWQDEKLQSLGRLAAGLAHELDNPASAASRGARLLGPALDAIGAAAIALGASGLAPEARDRVDRLVRRGMAPPGTVTPGALERATREEALADWLAARGVSTDAAGLLVERGIAPTDLDALAAEVPDDALGAALEWISAATVAHALAGEVGRSVTRVHDLVSAVRRFSYVDRAGKVEPTDAAQGLADTIAVLAARAREKDVAVTLDAAADLAKVPANTAALNQVWSSLLENAVDAAPQHGTVGIHAAMRNGALVVRIVDNGPGIPADVQSRMFDPFYTTKKVGEGSGLGLAVVRRVVGMLDGQVDVDTRPGRTEFRVRIPVPPATAIEPNAPR